MTDASAAAAAATALAPIEPPPPEMTPSEAPSAAGAGRGGGGGGRDPSNPWGVVVPAAAADGSSRAPRPPHPREPAASSSVAASPSPPAASAAAPSLADIMAQQKVEAEEGAALRDRLAAEEADRRLAERMSMEAEPAEPETDEERLLRMALAESLAESRRAEAVVSAASAAAAATAAAASPSSEAGAKGSSSGAGVGATPRKRVGFDPVVGGDAAGGQHHPLGLDSDEQMRLAIELSLRESAAAAEAAGGGGGGDDDDGGGKKPAASPAVAGHGSDGGGGGDGGGDDDDTKMPASAAAPAATAGTAAAAAASASASSPEFGPKSPPAAAASASATASASAAAASPAASASAAAAPHIGDDEALQIERALRDADDAEAAASLSLAMRLQEEEDRRGRGRERELARTGGIRPANAAAVVGNVRTATREDFLLQRGDSAGDHGGEGEEGGGGGGRKLWGADDYESHQEHFAHERSASASGGSSDDEEDGPSSAAAGEGFRMNPSSPSKSAWTRLDRNTVVSADGRQVRTKHDVRLKNVSNAERLLAMAADDDGLGVGGISGVSDRAYNALLRDEKKRSAVKGVAAHGTGRAEGSGGARTREGGMDANVRLVVSRAVNRGLIDGCHGIVKEGKEAVLYHADAGAGVADEATGERVGGSDGHDVAVKVFKRIQEFRGRGAYVDGDPRYRGRTFGDIHKRTQVELWAEKEHRNLVRANRAGVPVPTPLHVKENVLFMRFLGDEGWPAPQLRELGIRKGSPRWEALYCSILLSVRKLYHRAKLVHGDLSEYNVLVCPARLVDNRAHGADPEDLQPALIDLGQAVDVGHPRAEELLERDLGMIRSFFARQGIRTLGEEEALQFVRGDPSLVASEKDGDDDDADEDEQEEQERSGGGAEEGEEGRKDAEEDKEGGDAAIEEEPPSESKPKPKRRRAEEEWDDAADLDALQEKLARVQAEAAGAAAGGTA